jgi:WD40 repeat protein
MSSATPFSPALINSSTVEELIPVQSWNILGLNDMDWSIDATKFAIIGSFTDNIEDNELAVFSLETLEKIWAVPGSHSDLDFSPDGRTIAVASPGLTSIHSVNSDALVAEIFCATGRLVTYSGDSRLLAVAASSSRPSTGITLVRTDDYQCVSSFEHAGLVRSIALSPDGEYLSAQFSTTSDEVVTVWSTTSGSIICERSGFPPLFSPDGRLLVVPSIQDWTTELIDPGTCNLVHEFVGGGYPEDFYRDGSLVLESVGGMLGLWDLSSFENIDSMKGFPFPDAWHEVSPDWRSLLVYRFGEHAQDPGQLSLMQAPE